MSITGPVHRLFFTIVLTGICLIVPVQAAAPPTEAPQPAAATQWVAPDQEAAKKRAAEVVPFVEGVRDECRLCRQQRLRDQGLGVKDQSESYFLLDSPIIRQTEDHYGPVRFMHSKHAVVTKDCALCHHHRPLDESASETVRCSACHQQPFQKSHPERLGLKAAYHQQCMGCHREMDKGPIDCAGCHRKNVPDHKEKIQLAENPEPSQVTAECLRCHQAAGEDMLKSAHWLWKGPSPNTLDHGKRVDLGKATIATNNF
ncbi:hypothetical protein DSCOOX_51070 [Desulfosarcina ovata subsp. ovata]|nr:cytochrome c3 family protein [Desulfosarcina ovata]BBO91927.1 hypothetical protein DSCOOX_51070 [Desulfosarcina ovata subsp. ovata]